MFHAPCAQGGGEEEGHTGYCAHVGLPLLSAVFARKKCRQWNVDELMST